MITYYTTEHTRALVLEFFKEWLTFNFVEISIGKYLVYKESNCYVVCIPWLEPWTIIIRQDNM